MDMALGTEQTGDLMHRGQTMINQAVDRGTSLLADRVEHYLNVGREVSTVLRDRGEPQAAEFVETLSQRAQGIARYLRNNDGAAMWGDAQELARGKTWLLAGVGFVGGLALARTIRTAADSGWEREPGYVDSYAQPYAMTEGRESETMYERA